MDNPKTMRREQLLLLWKESDLPLIPHVHFRLDMQKHLILWSLKLMTTDNLGCKYKNKPQFSNIPVINNR